MGAVLQRVSRKASLEKVATVSVLNLMQEFLGKEFQVCSEDSVAEVGEDGRVRPVGCYIGCGKECDFYSEGEGGILSLLSRVTRCNLLIYLYLLKSQTIVFIQKAN